MGNAMLMKLSLRLATLFLFLSVSAYSFEFPDRNRIILFGTSFERKMPALFQGQLNTQLFSLFSNSGDFDLRSYTHFSLIPEKYPALFSALKSKTGPFKNNRGSTLSQQELLNSARSYLIILPHVDSWQIIKTQKVMVVSNKKSTNTLYRAELQLTVNLYFPLNGRKLLLLQATATNSSDHEISAVMNCVTEIGKTVAAEIEISRYFSNETEIYNVSGNNFSFYNMDSFIPTPGMEYKVFKTKRFPDGYVEEIFQGYMRVKKRNQLLWEGRMITGKPPQKELKLRYQKTANIIIAPVLRYYLPEHFRRSKYSSDESDIDLNNNNNPLWGGGFLFSWYTGYSFRLSLSPLYLFDSFVNPQFKAFQINLGLNWDLFFARNFIFTISLIPGIQYVEEQVGTGTSGSSAGINYYQPGGEVTVGFQWMPQPALRFQLYTGVAAQFENLAFDQTTTLDGKESPLSIHLKAKQIPLRFFGGFNICLKL